MQKFLKNSEMRTELIFELICV